MTLGIAAHRGSILRPRGRSCGRRRQEIPMTMLQICKALRDALNAIALTAVLMLGMCLVCAAGLRAQTYPSKLIKLVVPLSAGSPIDVLARIVAPALSARFKQTVIVENRPGGGTTIGTKAVATAAPDGQTLLFASAGHTLGPALTR